MGEPLIYLGTHEIMAGKLDEAKRASREMAEFLEANHPRYLHFEICIDDASRTMTVLQIHPDQDSLIMHLQLAGERIRKAYDFLVGTKAISIFGTPTDEFAQQITGMAGDAPVTFHTSVGGFTRLKAAG